MKNFRKAHAALSVALLLSSLSSFAMGGWAEYFGLSSSSDSLAAQEARAQRAEEAKRAERASLRSSNDAIQDEVVAGVATLLQGAETDAKLADSAKKSEQRAAVRAARDASFISRNGYAARKALSRTTRRTVKSAANAASSVKSGAKYVVTPFGKRSSTDRADYTKAIFSRFGTGRTGKFAVSLFQNANEHNYIANGVYYPSLALVAYAGYKYAPQAWNKVKAGYVSLKDTVNGYFAQKATLSGIITAANSKIEAVNNDETPGMLSGIVAKDYNMSLAINNLPEAKQKELSAAISAFDLAFTRRGNERAQAVDQALTGLETIVNELVAA